MRHSKLVLALAALASAASFSAAASAHEVRPAYHHSVQAERQQQFAMRQIERINYDLRHGLISPARAHALKAHYRAIAHEARAHRGFAEHRHEYALNQRMNGNAHWQR